MQVQGLMEIFDREWCHAYIWTPTGSALWTFRRDREYWKIAYEVSGGSVLYLRWDGTMQRFLNLRWVLYAVPSGLHSWICTLIVMTSGYTVGPMIPGRPRKHAPLLGT